MASRLQRLVPAIGPGKIPFRTHVSKDCTLIWHILAPSRRVSTSGQLSLVCPSVGIAGRSLLQDPRIRKLLPLHLRLHILVVSNQKLCCRTVVEVLSVVLDLFSGMTA